MGERMMLLLGHRRYIRGILLTNEVIAAPSRSHALRAAQMTACHQSPALEWNGTRRGVTMAAINIIVPMKTSTSNDTVLLLCR